MEKPPPRYGHLLGIIDPAEAVRVGNQVGKGVKMGEVAGEKCGQESGPLNGSDVPQKTAALCVNGHDRPPGDRGGRICKDIIGGLALFCKRIGEIRAL